jgi:hypothetical protein
MHEMSESFKDFLDRVQSGKPHAVLYVYKTQAARMAAMFDLQNEACARGLVTTVRRSTYSVLFHNGAAALSVAHNWLDKEVAGLTFDEVHGLDTLDGQSRAASIVLHIMAQVGRHAVP